MEDGAGRVLQCIRIRVCIRFRGEGAVSRNWAPTLRGGFGAALREISCSLRRDSCADCLLNRNCAYGYLFETPIRATDQVMRKYTQAPHPFVFEPDGASPPRVAEGDTGELAIVLVGGSYVYLPHVFLALQDLGKKGLGRDSVPYEILTVTSEDGDRVYDSSCGTILHPLRPKRLSLKPGTSRSGRFSLEFQTALRLQHEGEVCRKPDLAAIVAALHRRLFLLCYFHGGGCTEQLAPRFLDSAHAAVMLENTLQWEDAKRSSTRQRRSIPIGGAVGRIVCKGDIGVLEPLLRAGEDVHVGKNATFGLGKYRLVVGDEQ